MTTWKVCVYLTNEGIIEQAEVLEPHDPVPSKEHPAYKFLGLPYPDMLKAGWEETEEAKTSLDKGYENYTKKFLMWNEQKAAE